MNTKQILRDVISLDYKSLGRFAGVCLFTLGAVGFNDSLREKTLLRCEYLSKKNEITPEVRVAADEYIIERKSSRAYDAGYALALVFGARLATGFKKEKRE